MNDLTSAQPLIVGSPLASRVAPGAERGPLPYLFFSGGLSPLGSLDVRARTDYFAHDGREHYEASRRAIGAIGESIYMIHTDDGDVALLVLDAPGAAGVYDALGGALRPFHQWLERRALELFGLRPGLPGPAGNSDYSEVIFRWLSQ